MKKRHIIIGLIILALILGYWQRANIALRVLPRLIETALNTNPLTELGDGLHVTLCGAGSPMPDPRRSGPCVAVVAGEQLFIIDAGTNSSRTLGLLRYPQGAIAAVFLTHFHSDHIDGLGEIATIRWVSGNRTSPLPVYGPSGVSDIVAGFNTSYARDAVYRNDHHGSAVAPLSGRGMTALEFQVPATGESTVVYEHDGLRVQMIATDHYPIKPAVAYLFSYQGRSVLISGDTKKSANIEKFSQGVDLLVHEALSPELVGILGRAAQQSGNMGLAKIMADIPDYHTSPVEAAEIARDAGVGYLLYYHIVPRLLIPGMEAAWLAGVDEVFSDYTVGVDGTTFSMPPNSDEINKTRSGI